MNPLVYNSALVIHLIGIVLMAGASWVDLVVFRQFKKIHEADGIRAMVLEENMYRLQRFMGFGLLIIILSGVTMMAYLHQVWGAQLWFRIKMGLLLLIIINGLVIRRRLGTRLKALLEFPRDGAAQELIRNLTVVQYVQIILFIVIFVLSIFKVK